MNPTTTPPDAATPQEAAPRFPFDAVYKALFGNPRTVADMIRDYVAAPGGPLDAATLDALDLGTLRRLPSDWVTAEFRRLYADQLWLVDFRPEARERGYTRRLFIDLEFQSRPDHEMALRFLEYGAPLYRELRGGPALEDGFCPLLCVVLHNGAGRWTAPASAAGLLRTPEVLGHVPVPADLAAFYPWGYWPLDFAAHAGQPPIPGNVLSLIIGFETARQPKRPAAPELAPLMWEAARLDEPRLRTMMARWLAQLATHYNLHIPGLEELTAMSDVTVLTSRLEEWFAGMHSLAVAEGIAEGEARGEARGEAQGIAHERELLRWLAARRFDGETAARVGALLEDVADWDLLRSAAGVIVDAATGRELIDQVAALVRVPR